MGKGQHLKRISMHGRGRSGRRLRYRSHLTVRLVWAAEVVPRLCVAGPASAVRCSPASAVCGRPASRVLHHLLVLLGGGHCKLVCCAMVHTSRCGTCRLSKPPALSACRIDTYLQALPSPSLPVVLREEEREPRRRTRIVPQLMERDKYWRIRAAQAEP